MCISSKSTLTFTSYQHFAPLNFEIHIPKVTVVGMVNQLADVPFVEPQVGELFVVDGIEHPEVELVHHVVLLDTESVQAHE